MVARHPQRPHLTDFTNALITEFTPLAGDRKFGEDEALMGGFGRFRGESVCLIGQEKGATTESRIKHNFGMARPEGYRKAVRLMEMADRFGIPVLSLVDTAGAYPGIGAAERGQAEAIARSTDACLGLGVPNVAVIIGEGGSGGAIAIATANRVLMLEHAIYSVISPEAASSILWRDTAKAQDAATNMKITAQDLEKFKIVDAVVPEPMGGAHRDPQAAITRVGDAIEHGAVALLVRRGFKGTAPIPVIEVEDPTTALGAIAGLHRKRWGGTVVAVAGSAGKTTTRSAIAAALEAVSPGSVLASPGNLNNRIGVPMVLLGLTKAHKVAVVEIGTNLRGEVAQLVLEAPALGVHAALQRVQETAAQPGRDDRRALALQPAGGERFALGRRRRRPHGSH